MSSKVESINRIGDNIARSELAWVIAVHGSSIYNHSSLHRALRSHYTSPEKLAHHPKPVFGALEFTFEKLMLIRRLHLSLPDCLDGGILWSADGALGILIYLVQTPLMERVLAEKVDCWKVQGPSARHAPASLEDDRFASQLLEFLFLALCFSAITGYQAPILEHG